jgi:hypothetical protein
MKCREGKKRRLPAEQIRRLLSITASQEYSDGLL